MRSYYKMTESPEENFKAVEEGKLTQKGFIEGYITHCGYLNSNIQPSQLVEAYEAKKLHTRFEKINIKVNAYLDYEISKKISKETK